MNNITLITSEGCLGCIVMKNSITEAIAKTKVDIDFIGMNIKDTDKKFLRTFGISDTPCVLFFKDNKFLFKKVGSVPTVVVVQWINVHFK